MTSYLITGASRGLGLAMVGLLSAKPSSQVSLVFATARKTSPALAKLVQESSGRVIVLEVELTDEIAIQQAVAKVDDIVKNAGIDVLINNAGIMNYTPDGIDKMEDLVTTFCINVNTVHMVTKSFLPLLRKGEKKQVVNISSAMGSITRAAEFTFQATPAYKISKAALNMLTVQYSLMFAMEDFIIFAVDPGWVQTDMGSKAADLTVEDGSKYLLEKVLAANKDDNGKFFDAYVPTWEFKGGPNRYEGSMIPY